MNSNQVVKNVFIRGQRTSLRLEGELWDAMDEICRRERMVINELCSLIDTGRNGATRASTVRAFIVQYFRYFDVAAARRRRRRKKKLLDFIPPAAVTQTAGLGAGA